MNSNRGLGLLILAVFLSAAHAQGPVPAPQQTPRPNCGTLATVAETGVELKSPPRFVPAAEVKKLCRDLETTYNTTAAQANSNKRAYLLSEWPIAQPTTTPNLYIYTCYAYTCQF